MGNQTKPGPSDFTKCWHCGVKVLEKNLPRHIRKKHPGKGAALGPLVSSLILKNAKGSSNEICPICSGDGGVRGGCYKCGGSGWVPYSEKRRYAYSTPTPATDTRISNANYTGINQGAHYREQDGRIGSNPEHDDYSDEGTP